jgi:hypothetical protein
MSYIGNKPADKLLESADIADNSITTNKLVDASVTPEKISTAAKANGVIYENNQTITADYTLAASKNGLSAGPITIANGVTVTIATGATWTIV